MIRLDIHSDPICPWCMIGKAFLDRALAARPDHPLTIAWQPFQLNPGMPRDGMDRRVYLEAKFGSKSQAVAAYAQVAAQAERAGVTMDLAAIARTPNTLDAHRLIHWAGLEGRQTAVVSALFRAYFRDGRDIGAPETLLDIGADCGMGRALVARLLASDADVAETRSRDALARARGISAVPTFILDQRHAVSGAQPTEVWLDILDQIAGGTP